MDTNNLTRAVADFEAQVVRTLRDTTDLLTELQAHVAVLEKTVAVHGGCIDVLDDPAAFDALAKRVETLEEHNTLFCPAQLMWFDERLTNLERHMGREVLPALQNLGQIGPLEERVKAEEPAPAQPAPIAEGTAKVLGNSASHHVGLLLTEDVECALWEYGRTARTVRIVIYADDSEAGS